MTLLSIGKVSDSPGQGKGQGDKGKKGKKGKGMIEAAPQKIQPVYFGDDMGRVICTMAIGDDVSRMPRTFTQQANNNIYTCNHHHHHHDHDYDPTATGQYLYLQIAIMMMMMLIVVIIIIVRSHLGSSVRVACEARVVVG